MRTRQAAVTIGGACGLALSVVRVLAQAPAPVPIAQEPRHRVVFESGTTRVHDVQIPPGDTTLYHVHDTPILYVPISRSQTRSQVLGDEWSRPPTAAPRASEASSSSTAPGAASSVAQTATSASGRVSSIVSYVEKPVTHRVNNVGDSLFRLIAVVNRSAGSDSGADDVSGLSEKPEVVNRYYRAHRVTLAPGASTASHPHMTPVVVVQQAAGSVTVEGATTTELREPGTFAFHEGTGPHLIKNVGSTAVDVIEVELRGGGAR